MAVESSTIPWPSLDTMSREERSLLLYLETRAVDHGGVVCGGNMNGADFDTARRWARAGFIRFSRIRSDLLPRELEPGRRFPSSHVVVLTTAAAEMAAVERRRRAERSMRRDIVEPSLAHFERLNEELA